MITGQGLRHRWRRWTAALTVTVGAVFARLAWQALKLGDAGGAFRLKQELVRYGAALSGVIFVVLVLAVVIPAAFDRLEGRGFTTFVAVRHVRATKSGFLTVISVLSICGVAVSSCALCSVTSIMGGFGQDLKRKILGNNAHISIDAEGQRGFGDWQTTLDAVRLVPGVVAATPVVAGDAMASSSSNTSGALVRGVDPGSIGSVIDLVKNLEVGRLAYLEHPEALAALPADEVIGRGPGGEPYTKGPDPYGRHDLDPAVEGALRGAPVRPGIVIGREFAKTVHAYVGDEITLVSPLGDLGPMGVLPRARKFRVAAIFYSGMYEYDASHVYVLLDAARELFSMDERITTIEVKTDDAERASDVRARIEASLGRTDLRVRDWRELNKNLFSALKLERLATFVILSLAIVVASFCIICTLLLMVTEKAKEIAILKALGASDGGILRIFMVEGVAIGAIGTAFGVATGLAICLGLQSFGVRLDPEVYYIDRLPIAVNAADYTIVALAALAICTLSTMYPAWAASRIRPVEGLRYE